jgi:hypothetical protein
MTLAFGLPSSLGVLGFAAVDDIDKIVPSSFLAYCVLFLCAVSESVTRNGVFLVCAGEFFWSNEVAEVVRFSPLLLVWKHLFLPLFASNLIIVHVFAANEDVDAQLSICKTKFVACVL